MAKPVSKAESVIGFVVALPLNIIDLVASLALDTILLPYKLESDSEAENFHSYNSDAETHPKITECEKNKTLGSVFMSI